MVRDGDAHGVLGLRDIDVDGVALRVVDGVGEQIAQDALDAARVALDRDRVVWDVEAHLDAEFLGQMRGLLPGGVDAAAGVEQGLGQVCDASVVPGNLQEVREQRLEAVKLAGHKLRRAARVRLERVSVRRDEVRGHAHRGERRTQLVRDVRGELALQVAVLLELRNLFGQLLGHVVEGRRKAAHLVLALNDHALAQMAGGKALGNARGRTHRRDDLLGGQPGNADEEDDDHDGGGRQETAHERHRGFLGLHGQHDVDLRVWDIRVCRGTHDERVVVATVGLIDIRELIRDLVLGDEAAQVIWDAVPLGRGGLRAVRVLDDDDGLEGRVGLAIRAKLGERRARRIDAHLHGIAGSGGADLLLDRDAGAIDFLLCRGQLLVDEPLCEDGNERVGKNEHDHRGGGQNHANEAHLQGGAPRVEEPVLDPA